MAVFHVSLLYLQDSTQDGTLAGLLLCISPQKLRIFSVSTGEQRQREMPGHDNSKVFPHHVNLMIALSVLSKCWL
jgi:hypothetical protein